MDFQDGDAEASSMAEVIANAQAQLAQCSTVDFGGEHQFGGAGETDHALE